ncbi:MAG: glycoside hydrolase [Acidobacteriia bacterium]|nr:glycoside hydrolase [Terriglobia bacterium]
MRITEVVPTRFGRRVPCRATTVLAFVAAWAFSMVGCGGGGASSVMQPPPPVKFGVPLTTLSTDTFSNSSSQHKTEVEAGASAFGSTIVSAFQVGRIFGGGASDIGFATSLDSGTTWTSGFLPGLTVFQGGSYTAVSDPAVAFDAAHGVWMISTLPILAVAQVAVSRSTDGISWQNPVIISATFDSDKNWIACDDTATSPFYGHCYVEWDDPSSAGLIWMSTSTDGGLTWGPALNTSGFDAGIGGQPVVQPNGTVVVPAEAWSGASQLAFTSTDGGASWNPAVTISTITDHLVAGSLRTSPLPSAAVDGSGTVYVAWQDCRFRTSCAANDLVLSTSNDGNIWTSPARIPIDSLTSTADHFIPGLAVDPATGGGVAHIGLTYYFYPVTNCSAATCALDSGFISSHDGGSTWSSPVTLVGPMSLSSLPNTFAGLMVGDYVSTAFSGGKAFSIFEAANANVGSLFDEPTYATTTGFTVANNALGTTSIGESPVPDAHSDHPPRQFYDQEHRYPVPPAK